MSPTTSKQPAKLPAGALMVLLFGCFLPSFAQAKCAYGVRSHSEVMGTSLSLGLLTDYGSHRTLPGEPLRPAPCSGTMCSGEPGIPVAPVLGVQSPSDPCAILDAPFRTTGCSPIQVAVPKVVLQPILTRPPIFHPPRPKLSHHIG